MLTRHCFNTIAAFFYVGLTLGQSALAQGIDGTGGVPPLGVMVEDAAKIGIVQIVGRKQLYDLSSFARPTCGYLLRVKVLKSYKGGVEPFEFFSPFESDSARTDVNYFVMAFPKGRPAPTDLMAPIDRRRADFVAREHCAALHDYYVPQQIQTLWQFDGSQRFGGQWLAGANRTDGLLCGFGLASAKKFHTRTVAGIRIRFSGRSGYVTNWTDVEGALRNALAQPRFAVACGMDSEGATP